MTNTWASPRYLPQRPIGRSVGRRIAAARCQENPLKLENTLSRDKRMDRLESISAFVAVARSGGFSAAGRQLGIPLPTISRRVAELEQALGARLLHRTTRRIELTERGREFFTACERILDDLKDAEEAVAGEYRVPRGDLTVTAPVGFGRIHLQP